MDFHYITFNISHNFISINLKDFYLKHIFSKDTENREYRIFCLFPRQFVKTQHVIHLTEVLRIFLPEVLKPRISTIQPCKQLHRVCLFQYTSTSIWPVILSFPVSSVLFRNNTMLCDIQTIILAMSSTCLECVHSTRIHPSTKLSFCSFWEEWRHSVSILIYLDD